MMCGVHNKMSFSAYLVVDKVGEVGMIKVSPLGGLHSNAAFCSNRYWHRAACSSAEGCESFPGHTHNSTMLLLAPETNLGSHDVVRLLETCLFLLVL